MSGWKSSITIIASCIFWFVWADYFKSNMCFCWCKLPFTNRQMKTIQVFHINFWLNINHINYSTKMEIFVLNVNKMWNHHQIIKCISLKSSVLLFWFYFVQKVVKMWHLLYLYIWVLDYIRLCEVVLNIFELNMKYSVHSAHFNFVSEAKKMKKMSQNIQIDMENLYRHWCVSWCWILTVC